MRRFQCPECGELLIEGTTECPKCLAPTEGLVAPPSPGELFPEIQFGTHEQGLRFIELIHKAKERTELEEPEVLFYRDFQLSQWGSPWLEEYLGQVAENPALRTPHIDYDALNLQLALSRDERKAVRHVLNQLQRIPTEVQEAFLTCLKCKEWTPIQSLPETVRKWIPALERSGAVTTRITLNDRIQMLSDNDLRYLLASHELDDSGDRPTLLKRIQQQIEPEEFRGYVHQKNRGECVRCTLPIAAAFLRYVGVRRERIKVLVRSLLRRIQMDEQAANWCVRRDATMRVVDHPEVGMPPYHPGCSCYIELRDGPDHRRHVFLVAGAGACPMCLDKSKRAHEVLGNLGERRPGTGRPTVGRVELGKAGNCPRCRQRLYRARRYGLQFFSCSNCLGVWLPKDQVEDLFLHHFDLVGKLDSDMRLHSHDNDDAHVVVQCADCRTQLEDFPFAYDHPEAGRLETNITSHRCPECGGVWFDKGELHWIWRTMMEQMGHEF